MIKSQTKILLDNTNTMILEWYRFTMILECFFTSQKAVPEDFNFRKKEIFDNNCNKNRN